MQTGKDSVYHININVNHEKIFDNKFIRM